MGLSDMDTPLASASLKTLGYESNQDGRAPERSVEFFAHLLRDTRAVAGAKEEGKAFAASRKQQKDDDARDGVREAGGRKMKAVPDSFLFVSRVLGLLRGLCATLEAELPLVDILAFHARLGTREAAAAALLANVREKG
jgi:hypothetical protein